MITTTEMTKDEQYYATNAACAMKKNTILIIEKTKYGSIIIKKGKIND